MNTDIRLATRLRNSRKRMRFEAMLGENSFMHIIDLWLTAAMERPDGRLTGWDEIDICLAANWKGENADFMRAACSPQCAFIEKHKETYCLHDWQEHQAYACAAPERSEAARKAAKARWDKKLKREEKQTDNADAMRSACGGHAEGNAPSPSPTPTPNPSPKPIKKTRAKNGACQIPKDFKITDDMRSWFLNQNFQNIEIRSATDEFVDYWKSEKKVKRDWVATWRNGMRKMERWNAPKQQKKSIVQQSYEEWINE